MRLSGWLLLLMAGVGIVGCSESPVGPFRNKAAVDSAAWRVAMRGKVSSVFRDASGFATCDQSSCNFTPADYQCGGNKAECSTQELPVQATFPGPVSLITVAGQGAIQCNSTVGVLHAFDVSGTEIATVPLTLIDPSDCGADNVTYGAQATISSDSGIAYISIDAPAPATFPVDGGLTGIMSAFYTVQYLPLSATIPLQCSTSVVRGQQATCTASAPDPNTALVITSWTFHAATGTDSVARSTGQTSLSWGGEMATSGRVQVRGTLNGAPASSLPALITVQPRPDWPLPPPPHDSIAIPSDLPIHPTSYDSMLGGGSYDVPMNLGPSQLHFVLDGGPNDGYAYLASNPFSVDLLIKVNYEAMSTGSDFYLIQGTSRRRVGGKGGGYFMCARSDIAALVPIIEQHEGTSPATMPNSHAAIYARIADSLIQFAAESLAAPSDVLDPPAFQLRVKAIAKDSSDAMDYDSRNGIVLDGNGVLVPLGCKFNFDYSHIPHK